MNNEILKYTGGGIKCDNSKCDFVDQSVRIQDYDKWLNKPCPKCGSNLLTQADYDNVQMLLKLVHIVNENCPVTEEEIQNNNSGKTTTMTFNFNGSGKMEVEVNETEE